MRAEQRKTDRRKVARSLPTFRAFLLAEENLRRNDTHTPARTYKSNADSSSLIVILFRRHVRNSRRECTSVDCDCYKKKCFLYSISDRPFRDTAPLIFNVCTRRIHSTNARSTKVKWVNVSRSRIRFNIICYEMDALHLDVLHV